MSNSILIKKEGPVATLIMNRADKLNVLNKEMFEGLKAMIDVVESDKAVRILIITGAGEKAFCVGADLKECQGMSAKEILSRFEFFNQLYHKIEKLSIPVIAAMQGSAFGGGLELALACDLRVLAENAQVGLPEVDLAIIPGNGGTQRLTRVIGFSKALELIMLARRIGAKEALDCGLVHAVVPAEYVISHAKTWVNRILEVGPLALKQAKLAIRGGMHLSMEEALKWETQCYKALIPSKDRLEGMKAFLEKRKPEYRGE